MDLGPHSEESVDYPDYANALAQNLKNDPQALGVLICGTGIGVNIAANRHKWIRAAVCNDGLKVVKLARAHNHANVLCLGARLVENHYAKKALEAFIETPWEEGRHAKRVQKFS